MSGAGGEGLLRADDETMVSAAQTEEGARGAAAASAAQIAGTASAARGPPVRELPVAMDERQLGRVYLAANMPHDGAFYVGVWQMPISETTCRDGRLLYRNR